MASKFTIRINKVLATWNDDGRRVAKRCVRCKKKTKGLALSQPVFQTIEPTPACCGCTIDAVFDQVQKG